MGDTVEVTCDFCGKKWTTTRGRYEQQKIRSMTNKVACSRECLKRTHAPARQKNYRTPPQPSICGHLGCAAVATYQTPYGLVKRCGDHKDEITKMLTGSMTTWIKIVLRSSDAVIEEPLTVRLESVRADGERWNGS